MNGPEFLTHEEEKQLAHLVDLDVESAFEEKHIHEEIVNEEPE